MAGVRAGPTITNFEGWTSTSPVASSGFRMFAGRATTSPSTSTTVSPVRPPAIRRTSSGALGPTATCTRPARSRRSMNTIPPRSRRRCTHPPKRTRCPACCARSSPQRSVRLDVRLTLLMLPPPRTRRDRTLRATWRRAAGRAPAPAARGARCGSTPSRALPPRIRGRPRGRTGAPARRRSSRTAPARGSFRPPPRARPARGFCRGARPRRTRCQWGTAAPARGSRPAPRPRAPRRCPPSRPAPAAPPPYPRLEGVPGCERETRAQRGARASKCPKHLKIVKLVHVRHATHLSAPGGVRPGGAVGPAGRRHGALSGRRDHAAPTSRARYGWGRRLLESRPARYSGARQPRARSDPDRADRRCVGRARERPRARAAARSGGAGVRSHGDRRPGAYVAQPRPRSGNDPVLYADARRDMGNGVGGRWDRARRHTRLPGHAPRRGAVEPLDARCRGAPQLCGCRDARRGHALLLAVRHGGRGTGVVRRARGARVARPAVGEPGGAAGPVRHRHGARLLDGSSVRGGLRARPAIRVRPRGGAGRELWAAGMAGGDGGARGRGPVSRELRTGLRRERRWRGVPRGSRRAGSLTDLLSLTPDAARAALAEWLTARAEPGYRLTQILPRLWQRPVGSREEATDLPDPLWAQPGDASPLARLTCDDAQLSSDGTEKFLWM